MTDHIIELDHAEAHMLCDGLLLAIAAPPEDDDEWAARKRHALMERIARETSRVCDVIRR